MWSLSYGMDVIFLLKFISGATCFNWLFGFSSVFVKECEWLFLSSFSYCVKELLLMEFPLLTNKFTGYLSQLKGYYSSTSGASRYFNAFMCTLNLRIGDEVVNCIMIALSKYSLAYNSIKWQCWTFLIKFPLIAPYYITRLFMFHKMTPACRQCP